MDERSNKNFVVKVGDLLKITRYFPNSHYTLGIALTEIKDKRRELNEESEKQLSLIITPWVEVYVFKTNRVEEILISNFQIISTNS